MFPVLTLTRPEVALAPEDRHLRAVDNDGLTDVEREDLAGQYRLGAGRQPSVEALADIAAWLEQKRGGAQLA